MSDREQQKVTRPDPRGFSTGAKFLIVLGVLSFGGLSLIVWNTFAGTQLGMTLKLSSTTGGLDNGLVGHWTFDGVDMQSGQVNDTSGNGNNGSMVNMSTSTAYVQGAIGQAFKLDGVDDYVEINGAANDFGVNSDFSMSAWVKVPPVCKSTKICTIIGRNTSAGGNRFIFTIGDNVGGTALDNELAIHDGVSSAFEGDTNTVVADDTWHHVGYVLTGTTGTLYVDGVAKSTHTADYVLASSDLLSIGQEWDTATPSDFFPGTIDDVRFYNRAVTSDEITQLYQLGATTHISTTPSPSPAQGGLDYGLVAHYTFDGKDTQTGQVNDTSGNAYHGSEQGFATSSAYVTGTIGQAINLDGINDQINITSHPSSLGTNFTFSFWANYDGSGGSSNKHMLDIRGSGSSVFAVRFATGDAFFRDSPGNQPTGGQPLLSVATSTWAHYVAVADGTNVLTYRDGVLINTKPWGRTLDTSGAWYIGRSDVGARYKGLIDDFRIYNRALSPDEIKQLYQLGATTHISTTPSPSPTQGGLDYGLVGHWTFDGKDTQTGQVNDTSGQGNHGSMKNMSTSTAYVQGAIGQGMQFDGVNDVIAYGASTNLLRNVSQASMSFWAKTQSNPSIERRTVSVAIGTDAASFRFTMAITTSDKLIMYGRAGDGESVNTLTGVGTLSLGDWHHYVGVWDYANDAGFLYVDGQLISSTGTISFTATATSNTSPANVSIGAKSSLNVNFFNGSLDDVRIYNRALTDDEVKQLYQMGQ